MSQTFALNNFAWKIGNITKNIFMVQLTSQISENKVFFWQDHSLNNQMEFSESFKG